MLQPINGRCTHDVHPAPPHESQLGVLHESHPVEPPESHGEQEPQLPKRQLTRWASGPRQPVNPTTRRAAASIIRERFIGDDSFVRVPGQLRVVFKERESVEGVLPRTSLVHLRPEVCPPLPRTSARKTDRVQKIAGIGTFCRIESITTNPFAPIPGRLGKRPRHCGLRGTWPGTSWSS